MDTTTDPPEFRKRAQKKVAIGLLGCLGMAGLFVVITFAGYMPAHPFMLILAAILFVCFCGGLIELPTGRPYQQVAGAWMALRGWQRGGGTLIVLVAGFLIIVVMKALVMWFT